MGWRDVRGFLYRGIAWFGKRTIDLGTGRLGDDHAAYMAGDGLGLAIGDSFGWSTEATASTGAYAEPYWPSLTGRPSETNQALGEPHR